MSAAMLCGVSGHAAAAAAAYCLARIRLVVDCHLVSLSGGCVRLRRCRPMDGRRWRSSGVLRVGGRCEPRRLWWSNVDIWRADLAYCAPILELADAGDTTRLAVGESPTDDWTGCLSTVPVVVVLSRVAFVRSRLGGIWSFPRIYDFWSDDGHSDYVAACIRVGQDRPYDGPRRRSSPPQL